jgi:hypothetical protein
MVGQRLRVIDVMLLCMCASFHSVYLGCMISADCVLTDVLLLAGAAAVMVGLGVWLCGLRLRLLKG